MIAISPLLALAMLLTAAAGAQQAPPAAGEHRLNAGQIEAVLAEAARKREAAERGNPSPGLPESQLRGEIGVSIGTGGHRGAFGTVILPMSDDSAAALSVDFIDLGKRRHRH